MCGFVGYISKKKYDNNQEIIRKMADRIIHRGPDSDGYLVDDKAALGFRRLAIIDLEEGGQPIYNEKNTMAIVFNGEIYNYQELREELIKLGHTFKTKSDTEVILHGYEEYKEEVLNKLRGMFAFVIYDIENKKLFGARDFFGIKPFYYATMDDTFIFGSEVKAFLEHPDFKIEENKDLLENYLTFQFTPGNDTLFKNVYHLQPGHYFTYESNNLQIKQYYQINFDADNSKTTDQWIKEVEDVLNDSITAHKVSDVEIGSFLSSGVDSSVIAVASKVDKTFTVGFKDSKYSEIPYVKELSNAVGIQNISKEITKEEFFDAVPKVIYHLDEPLGDPSVAALYFVANTASKHVKVCFSGEGADELFGGYPVYKEQFTMRRYDRIPFFIRFIIGKIASLFPSIRGFNFLVRRGKKLEDRYVGVGSSLFQEKEIKKILKEPSNYPKFNQITKPYFMQVKDKDDATKMQFIDAHFWLVKDILKKGDAMSMANSLEVRVPFLDKKLWEIGRKLPTHEKVDAKQTKKLFRKVAEKIVPKVVADRKKLGFPVPIREWLREEDVYLKLKQTFEDAKDVINPKYPLKLLKDHYENKGDYMRKIWTIYTYLLWRDIFINKKHLDFVEKDNI